ncbi:MAG: PadR family transcriptional regulator [Acidimicrobiia bacterium]
MKHGYEMIQQIEERSSGVWRPSPGAVYPAFNLLEDEGLSPFRRGRRQEAVRAHRPVAQAVAELVTAPWDEVTQGMDPAQFKLRDAIKPIAIAAHQALEARPRPAGAGGARRGRRKLYAILAEDPAES